MCGAVCLCVCMTASTIYFLLLLYLKTCSYGRDVCAGVVGIVLGGDILRKTF